MFPQNRSYRQERLFIVSLWVWIAPEPALWGDEAWSRETSRFKPNNIPRWWNTLFHIKSLVLKTLSFPWFPEDYSLLIDNSDLYFKRFIFVLFLIDVADAPDSLFSLYTCTWFSWLQIYSSKFPSLAPFNFWEPKTQLYISTYKIKDGTEEIGRLVRCLALHMALPGVRWGVAQQFKQTNRKTSQVKARSPS